MPSNFISDEAVIFPSSTCIYDSSIGYSADFTVNGEVDGWEYFDGIHTYGAWNGFLFGTLIDDYGIIGRYNVFRPVDADTHYTLKLIIKYNPIERQAPLVLPTRAKVRWTTLSSPTYNADKEKYFDIVADNKWHTYIINMGSERYWQGDINNLRIWLPVENGVDGDEFFIRAIDILSVDTHQCLNASCSKYEQYSHPCPWTGKRGTITSSAHENNKRFNITDGEEFIVNINDYGNEIIKIREVSNAVGQEVANALAKAISRLDIGGYAEVQVEYTEDNRFKIYSGTRADDSSVIVVDNDLAKYLGFFNYRGDTSTRTTGEFPVNGYSPLSNFRIKTFQALSLFDNDEQTGLVFNPFNYSIEGGRQDWIGSSTGSLTTSIGENDGDESGQVIRNYYLIFNDGRTIIDFNHPFNASGRINKIWAACTLDMWFDKTKHEVWIVGGDDIGRKASELRESKVLILRPKRDGTLDVVHEFDIRDRDHTRDIGDELMSLTQEALELEVDVFVNKGDLLGIYNANLYVGKSISGAEVDAQYFQIDGKPTENFNPGRLYGNGSAGVLMYARGNERQRRLVLDIDLRHRYNIENIEIKGQSSSILLEYNIARCLDINWEVELFDQWHWTYHKRIDTPYEYWYQRYNVAYGIDKLNDGIKIVNNGLACDSFSLTTDQGAGYPPSINWNAGPGVVPVNPYYFWVNGDEEWLAVWLHAGTYQTSQAVLDFEEDPIAIYLHFPFEKEKTIYKSIIYFKEKYNFRNFALSTYRGYYDNLGNADDLHYQLIPGYTAITLDKVRYEPGSPLYDDIDKYLFQNPCYGSAVVVKNNDLTYEWDPIYSDLRQDYTPEDNPYFSYQTGYIENQDEWQQALRIDWQTIQHEWEPVRCKGFRIFTNFHRSTKITEIELYGVASDIGSAFAGSITVIYSDYSDIYWPTESVQLDENLTEVYIGDTPRYLNIDIVPIIETRYDDILFNIKAEDLYVGSKGCQFTHYINHSKLGASNQSQVIELKNTYQNEYDLYVDIAPDKLLQDGIMFYSKLNDANSINNPLIGPDAVYYKLPDYSIRNVTNNCAINCHTYGLRNLIQGRTAYYSYDDMVNWLEYGELAHDQIIDFNNLPNTTRTFIFLPMISRNRYWKFGFKDPDVSMNVRELRIYDIDDVQYIDNPMYHDINKSWEDGGVVSRAPHLENDSVTGSYYTLTYEQFITLDLGGSKTLKMIELVHDGINDYTFHEYDENIAAGIDRYTKLYVLPWKDRTGYHVDDFSYYEHPVHLMGSAQVVDGATYSKIEKTITITSGTNWDDWNFKDDYSGYSTISGTYPTTITGVSVSGIDYVDFDLNINNSSEDGVYTQLIPGTDFVINDWGDGFVTPLHTYMWQDVGFETTFKLHIDSWEGGVAVGAGFTAEIAAAYHKYKSGASVHYDPSSMRFSISTRQGEACLEPFDGFYSLLIRDTADSVMSNYTVVSGVQFLDLTREYFTASDTYSTSSVYNLLDGSQTTYWTSLSSQPWWFKLDLSTVSSGVATKYKLSSGSSGASYMPKTWQFQGSQNDSDWDILDEVVSVSPAWGLNETRIYTFSGTVGYNYYRFYFSNGYSSSNVRVWEFDILDSTDKSLILDHAPFITASNDKANAHYAIDSNVSTGSYWSGPASSSTYDDVAKGYPSEAWLKYDFGAGNSKVIKQYRIYANTTYDPREWYFQGSNDNVNWTILDHQRHQSFVVTNPAFMCYPAINETAYRYYRIRFLYLNYYSLARIYDFALSEYRQEDYYIKFISEGSKIHRDHREQSPGSPTADHYINYKAQLWYDSIDGAQLAGEVTLGSHNRWDADKFGFFGSHWVNSVEVGSNNDVYPRHIKGTFSELNVAVDYESYNCPFDEDLITTNQYAGIRIPEGTDNYIKVNNTLDLDFKNHRYFIDFWVKFNQLPESNQRIFIFETSEGVNGIALALYNVGDRYYRMEWWVNGGLREYFGMAGYSYDVPIDYFNTQRWYYLVASTGKNNSTQGMPRLSFFDINGRALYDDAYVSTQNSIYTISTGQDIIIGRGFDGWVSSIRISIDDNDTINTGYSHGGNRMAGAGGANGLMTFRKLQPVPFRPFEKLYTFSFYVSDDNRYFGHYADVDSMFADSYSYFVEGSIFAEKYNSYFAIDLGDQHNLEIFRHYGQASLYNFAIDSNTIYSSIDTDNPDVAFQTELSVDPDDSFEGYDNQSPDKNKWSVIGIDRATSNYIRLRNGHLEMKANATEPGPHGIKSNYALKGDFDIEVRFGRSAPDTFEWYSTFGVKLADGEDGETSVVMRVDYDTSNPANYYYVCVTFTNNGTAVTYKVELDSNNTGMRIVRNRYIFTCYYYDSGWKELEERPMFDSLGKEIDYIFMTTGVGTNNPSTANYYYDFKINSYDRLFLRSDHENARWVAINLLNGDNVDRYIYKMGIYPDITQNIVPGGNGYNCEWDDLGPAITAYSEGINVALGTTVTGSSFVSNLDYSRAVDGILYEDTGKKFTNVWATDNTSEQWLQLDFGEEKEIYRVKLYHGHDEIDTQYMIQDYYIEVSTDDISYTTIFNITGNSSFERIHDLAEPVTARYLRLYITGYISNLFLMRDETNTGELTNYVRFEGAVLRQIQVYSYYGYSTVSSEEYPVIAINLRDQFYLTGHELVGFFTEDDRFDWDNDDSNFTYTDSVMTDPQKVKFKPFGSQPNYEQWVAIKRNTASYYNADPAALGGAPPDYGIDYLKHAIIRCVEEPNPTDYNWWWEADISTISRDYSKPVELSTSSLRIDYPASTALEHVRFLEGSNFGIDEDMARRDGLAFRFYIEDIDKFDTSQGYLYWGGLDGTPQQNRVEYRWNWSTLSGTTALQTGWNRPYFRFRNADEVVYTPLMDPARPIDPLMREYMTMQTAGLKFKGFGQPFHINIDGFVIQRNHFNDYSAFGQGLYLAGSDYLTTPLGEIDFVAGTIEFFLRPDYNFSGLDEFRRYRNRSIFHFGNVLNDIFGMMINSNGINFYYGNISDQIGGFLIQGLTADAIDQIWHMGIVFSNNGKYIGADNSTIRFYVNNRLIGVNYTTWEIGDGKSWKFTLGGKAPLALIEHASSLETTSIEGVISDLRIYNYCKTDFTSSLQNLSDSSRLVNPYLPSKLIEISRDNVTFYKVGDAGLPFTFEKVQPNEVVPIYVRSIVPLNITGYESRTSGIVASWDVGV